MDLAAKQVYDDGTARTKIPTRANDIRKSLDLTIRIFPPIPESISRNPEAGRTQFFLPDYASLKHVFLRVGSANRHAHSESGSWWAVLARGAYCRRNGEGYRPPHHRTNSITAPVVRISIGPQ